MFQRVKQIFNAILERLGIKKQAYKRFNIDTKAQEYLDIDHINFLAMAVTKLTNLSSSEATFEIDSDSTQTERLKELLSDIENKKSFIVSGMLGTGDYFVFPYTDADGEICHSYLDAERVRILATNGDKITKLCALIDYTQKRNSTKTVFLLRVHELDENGTLSVYYDTVNEGGQHVNVDEWDDIKDNILTFAGAHHIGVGRYKCPTSSRGLSGVYGVPMNFGCGDIEESLKVTMEQILKEYKNAESLIFTDPRNLEYNEKEKRFEIIGNIIPVKINAGQNGTRYIDIYSPEIRSSAFYEKLTRQLADLERQMGLSKGIFTENDAMITGTATAVRRSNADTIAYINAVHAALDDGNVMTLEADGIFLGIRRELWEYQSDYFDPFADPTEQWNVLLAAFNAGAVEREDLTRWVKPGITDEQLADMFARIDAQKDKAAMQSLNAMLGA